MLRRVIGARCREPGCRPFVTAIALGAWSAAAPARADDEVDAAVVRAPRAAPGETRIGHAEIERTGGVTLADALRPQADVDTPGGGAAGAVGRLTLRGSTPEEVLLMVDGLRLSSRSSASIVGGADPNLIPTAMVQRVAILRGPSSALYGPNAVAGAVEITTRAPAAPLAWTGNLQLGALAPPTGAPPPAAGEDAEETADAAWFLGGRGQLTAAARQGSRFAVLGLSGGAHRGWLPNTRSHLLDATLKVGRTLPGGGLTHAWVSAFDAATGAPAWGSLFDADMFDADDRQARRGVMGAALARVALSPRDTLEVTAGSRVQRTQLFNPAGADLAAGSERAEDEHRSRELQARLRWQRARGGALGALTVSAEAGHDALVTTSLARSAARGALAVRDRLDLGRDAVLDLAVRADLDGQYGAQVSPRVAAEWSVGPSLRAFAAVGRGYRPPSFAELAWPTIAYAAAVGVARGERGNDALAVETAWGGDAALVGGAPGGRWSFAARGFALRTEGLIRWALDGEGYWRPVNEAVAWRAGATAEGTWRPHRRWTVLASAAWQTTVDENGDALVGRLRARASARVIHYQPVGWRAWAEALWFDRNGADSAGRPWRGVFVNARIGRQFASGVGVFALAENLLDLRYESVRGVLTPGRTVWVGVALDMDED